MSLSVSSFPAAPPTLPSVRQPRWHVSPSLKSSRRFLGTLLGKRPVPFLKGVGHYAKTHVKRSIIRQRTNLSRSQWIFKHHYPLSRSSNRPASIVIDITPISNNDKYFSASSSDVDASSLNPTIEIFPSPTIGPPSPTAAKDFPAVSPTESVKTPYQSSVQSLVRDSARAHEAVVQHSANEHEGVASDSEPHDPQPPGSETTTPLPISPSLKTPSSLAVPVPLTEGRRRPHSVSAGVEARATKTELPTRPRYKSETAAGLPRLTIVTPSEPIPQPPATASSTHTSGSTISKKQRRGTIFKRVRARSAGPSTGKSTGGDKAMEPLPLRARMFSLRSVGSRLSLSSRHGPSTAPPPLQTFPSSDIPPVPVPKSSSEQLDLLLKAFPPTPQSHSPSSPVDPGLSDDPSEQWPLLPSSVDRGLWLRLAAVPHAESCDGVQNRRRPRTAPEAVLMANW